MMPETEDSLPVSEASGPSEESADLQDPDAEEGSALAEDSVEAEELSGEPVEEAEVPEAEQSADAAEGENLTQEKEVRIITGWNWEDPDAILQETEGSWTLEAGGEENPLTCESLLDLLPGEVEAAAEDGENLKLELSWDLSAIPEEGIREGSRRLTAELPQGFVLAETAPALEVTLNFGETAELEVAPDVLAANTVPGISPQGTVINVFDYWVSEQNAPDNLPEKEIVWGGINVDEKGDHRVLAFSKDYGNSSVTFPSADKENVNRWTGNMTPRQGIVLPQLGSDGYPVLSEKLDGGSLSYLFDPAAAVNGKESYEGAEGLLQVDENGYYYYDSSLNFAEFNQDKSSPKFTLYDTWGVRHGGTSPDGQFFPFNTGGQVFEENGGQLIQKAVNSEAECINHYFGVTMSTRFVQDNGGYTKPQDEGGKPVTYEFSGDDDVWIFIDDVLVADLGGIHDKTSLKIDFSTGEIIINEGKAEDYQQKTTLKEAFELAGVTVPFDGDTFADKTYHTLKFFYLERGNTDSNMSLKFNLVNIPESSVIKVDQRGEAVPGAEFELWTDEVDPKFIAEGVTGADGKFIFYDNDGFPLSIDDIYNTYRQVKLRLKETVIPPGYRSSGDMILYFHTSPNGNVVLLSENHWQTGAYAMPRVTASLPSSMEVYKVDAEGKFKSVGKKEPADAGVLFAVIMQKQSDGSWCPVYGDPSAGWTVLEDGSWDSIKSAAIQNLNMEHDYRFILSSSGAYQVTIDNLPGDVKKYYYMMGEEERDESAEYTVAYYYSDAKSLNEVNGENTYLINPPNLEDQIERVFSVDLYVPNIKNRLMVQKTDEAGNAVNGAGFALYSSDQVKILTEGKETADDIYELSDGRQMKILEGEQPYDSCTTFKIDDLIELDGGGVFPTAGKSLVEGIYYLVETSAPDGYELNKTAVKIVVDNTGVYADAGGESDGVSVLKGIGSIVRSMVQFAAKDRVDTTLNEVKAAVAAGSYDQTGFSWQNASWDSAMHLQYQNSHAVLDYGPLDEEGTLDNLTIETETGWSKLFIRQCYKHDEKTDTSLKEDLKDQDITGLFSGTTIVRVKDKQVGNLKISKTVEDETGQASQDQAFTFKLSFTKDDQNLEGEFQTKKTENQIEKTETITIKDGTAEISLKDGESLEILGLPVGTTYTVTETDLPPGYTVSVTGDGSPTQDGQGLTGTIRHVTAEDGTGTIDITSEVNFTNTFSNAVSVPLQGKKTLDGGTLTAGQFEFELLRTDSGSGNAVEMPDPLKVKSDADGKFQFGDITFKEAGIYTFEIQEVIPEDTPSDGILYDEHVTTVTVTVTENPETKLLQVGEISYNNKTASSDSDQIVTDEARFTNYVADDLEFTKVNGKKEHLSGAVFALYSLDCQNEGHDHSADLIQAELIGSEGAWSAKFADDYKFKDCWKQVQIVESGQVGLVKFENLPVSKTYRLVELKAPDGYVLPKGQWGIRYNETNQEFTFEEGAVGNPPAYNGEDNTLLNYQPTELPLSGNRGIRFFALAGGALMIAGSLGFLRSRKRKSEETA